MSRYMPELIELALRAGAKAAYAFFVEGDRGTGGCPIVVGAPSPAEYERLCRELIGLLRRSADMLEADLVRQGFPKGGQG